LKVIGTIVPAQPDGRKSMAGTRWHRRIVSRLSSRVSLACSTFWPYDDDICASKCGTACEGRTWLQRRCAVFAHGGDFGSCTAVPITGKKGIT
jgi:hypothetical protein